MEQSDGNDTIEIWKDLPKDLKLSKYEVSNFGRIKNKDYIFNPSPKKRGYLSGVFVSDDDTRKPYLFHRLVAKAFIDNPENKPTVDHINKAYIEKQTYFVLYS